MYISLDGKRCCHFIGLLVAFSPDTSEDTRLMVRSSPVTTVESSDLSQPHDSGSVNIEGMAQLHDYPPMVLLEFT